MIFSASRAIVSFNPRPRVGGYALGTIKPSTKRSFNPRPRVGGYEP